MHKEPHPAPTNVRNRPRVLSRYGAALALALLLAAWAGCRDNRVLETETEGPSQTATDSARADFDRIENGIHLRTGFVAAEGLTEVIQNCTPCHSAKLVTQNRMTRDGWEATIRWMQQTQNLWGLGANESVILDYLATYYAPEDQGRRENLKDIEWYVLEP